MNNFIKRTITGIIYVACIVTAFMQPFAMLFLLFYRFPEALLGKMSVTFLMRPNSAGGLGLSPQEFGLASGTIGVIGLTLGGILGGLLAGRDGFKRPA